jgi:hypothetical protein
MFAAYTALVTPVRALVSGLLVWAGAASAEPATCPAAAAEKARAAHDAQDLAAVIAATQSVERCADGTAHELAEAMRWRAQALAEKGSTKAAVTAFAWLFTVEAGFTADPPLAPEVQQLADEGRQEAAENQLVLVRLMAPVKDASGTYVRAEVLGPVPPSRVEAIFKNSKLVAATRDADGLYRAQVPAGPSKPYRFRAIIEDHEFTSFTEQAPAVGPKVSASGEPIPTVRETSQRRTRYALIPLAAAVILTGIGVVNILVGNGQLLPIAQGDPTITTVDQLDARIGQAKALQYSGVALMCIGGAVALSGIIWAAYERQRVITVSLTPGGAGIAFAGTF